MQSLQKGPGYEPKRGGYETFAPVRKFNRALYGTVTENRHCRFRLLAGDLPEAMLFLPGNGGRIFWAVQAGKAFQFVSDFESIHSRYDGGIMRYHISDRKWENLKINITMMPLAKEEGAAFHVIVSGLKHGWRFITFYGAAGGWKAERCMDAGYFSYTNDEKAIPFRSENCAANEIGWNENQFYLKSETTGEKPIYGCFGFSGEGAAADAAALETGRFVTAETAAPRVFAYLLQNDTDGYLVLRHSRIAELPSGTLPEHLYRQAEEHCKSVAAAAVAQTPDVLLNSAVRAACTAMEGIWAAPCYMHGAWSWNMPLMGWRSMYGPCTFGSHSRIRLEAKLFTGLQVGKERTPRSPRADSDFAAKSFSIKATGFPEDTAHCPDDGKYPDPDPQYALARQSLRSVFISEGFIPYCPTKPWRAQYNMQEVFFDELIYEYYWTGDESFAKDILPPLLSHIRWEKKCFDADNDGLYENFANFWASDGMFYSGAGCALASAYTYRANIAAAELLRRFGGDPLPYEAEAEKIKKSLNEVLWLEKEGHPAECRDACGERLIHPSASVPTIVHCAESGVLDDFQLYQSLQYTKNCLERKPVDGGGELVWNTNWVPYVWSVRDIDYADVLHLSLAYFLAGDREGGYRLLEGAMRESTCRNVSPGAFLCVFEGKSIDFADTVSMFGRTVVEGLFGMRPRMDRGTVAVCPSFPPEWNKASIKTPDLSYDYEYNGIRETIAVRSGQKCTKTIRLAARKNSVQSIRIDGREADFRRVCGIGRPYVEIETPAGETCRVEVEYAGTAPGQPEYSETTAPGEHFTINMGNRLILRKKDPQKAFADCLPVDHGNMVITAGSETGYHTLFVLVRDGEFEYWVPVNTAIRAKEPENKQSSAAASADRRGGITLAAAETVDLSSCFNARASDIFKQEYRSPRSPFCSLQVPLHLFPSDWCVTDSDAIKDMNDLVLRNSVSGKGIFMADGIPFAQVKQPDANNVIFVSKWDNYPDCVTVPLSAPAGDKIYFLITGYTNQMQCYVTNAILTVKYRDGSEDQIRLINPANFRSLEKGPETERPCDSWCYQNSSVRRALIGHYSDDEKSNGIYAQILSVDSCGKAAESVEIRAVANDVVAGLMGITVLRNDINL